MNFEVTVRGVENHQVFLEGAGARAEFSPGVESHAGAVEHQLVVSPHLIHVDHRNVARIRDGLQHVVTQLDFLCTVRRRGNIQQQIGPGVNALIDRISGVELFLPEMLVVPDVFADGDSELETIETHGAR